MNARAIQLVGRLRHSLDLVPGAASAEIWESRAWTLVTVVAATPDSCYSLALLLGAGAPRERRVTGAGGGYVRWLCASSQRTERGRGLVQMDIVGASAGGAVVPGAGRHGAAVTSTLPELEGALHAAGWKLIDGPREVPGGVRAAIQRGEASKQAVGSTARGVLEDLLRSALVTTCQCDCVTTTGRHSGVHQRPVEQLRALTDQLVQRDRKVPEALLVIIKHLATSKRTDLVAAMGTVAGFAVRHTMRSRSPA